MSKAGTYIRNLLANWLGYALNMVVLFFLSPFIIQMLGVAEYGVWNLLVTLTGSMGLLDLGIRASTERYIILFGGLNRSDLVNDTIRTSMGVFSVLCGVILLLGGVLGWLFPSMFRDVPPDHYTLVMWLLPMLALNIWMTMLSTTFSSVLASHDRYDFVQLINVSILGVRTVGTVVVLHMGMGILGLALVVVSAQVFGAAGNFLLARHVFKEMNVWPPAFSRGRLKELAGYGAASFIAAVAYRIIHQVDLLVVGAMISAPMVAIYAIGAMLPEYIWGFVDQVGRTFYPPIQRAAAKNDTRALHLTYIRQAVTCLFAGLPAYVGILVLGGPFLRLWMARTPLSEADLNAAVLVMSILCGSRLVFLFGFGAAPLLSAIGYIKFNAVIGVIEAVMNLALSVAFVLLGMGVAGVAAGTLVAMMVVRGIVHPWYACRKARMSVRLYVMRVIMPGLLAGGLFYLWCAALRRYLPATTWGAFGLQVLLALALYFPAAFWVLYNPTDRHRIMGALIARITGKPYVPPAGGS